MSENKETSEAKPHVLAMRRFLISSSSSSSAASTPRRPPAALHEPPAAGARNTSSLSSDITASSSATSARNFSPHSTPPSRQQQQDEQARPQPQQHNKEREAVLGIEDTVEKVIPQSSPTEEAENGARAAEQPPVDPPRFQRLEELEDEKENEVQEDVDVHVPQPRRPRSRSDDSVESQDYVDALASSAFQDCQSAARTLYSTQGLLSFTDAQEQAGAEAVDESPTPLQGKNEVTAGEDLADGVGGSAQAVGDTEHDDDDDDQQPSVTAPTTAAEKAEAVFFSPLTVTEGEDVEGDVVDEKPFEATKTAQCGGDGRDVVMADSDAEPETPPSERYVVSHVPVKGPPHEAEHSPDTSSSQHQVGVWKAIYGKEKWSGPRRSYSREDDAATPSTSNTDERDVSERGSGARATAAAVREVAVPADNAQHNYSSPAALTSTSRHADSSQWAASRKTALEMLRAQLDSTDVSSGATGAPKLSQLHCAAAAAGDDEPSIVEAVVEEVVRMAPPLPPNSQTSRAAEPAAAATSRSRVAEPAKEDEEDEVFEVVEMGKPRLMSPQDDTDAVVASASHSEAAKRKSNTEAASATAVGQTSVEAASLSSSRRSPQTAEGVLAELFGGVIPSIGPARSNEHSAAESGGGNGGGGEELTSPFKAHHLVFRPALSADVSGISPIKNEAPSILADLYDSPESRPARAARTPLSVDPALPSDRSPLPLSSPGERSRHVRDAVLDGRQEQTQEMSNMDFRTAQTAPTGYSSSAASSSAFDETPVRPTAQSHRGGAGPHEMEEEDADEQQKQQQWQYEPEDSEAVDRYIVAANEEELMERERATRRQREAASALRTDARVSIFPPTTPNAWDASRVMNWRQREEQDDNAQTPTTAVAAAAATGSNATTAAALRQERVRREMKARELAECTFHPTLSPGTRAMVRMAQEKEIERSLLETPTPPARRGRTTTAADKTPSAATQKTGAAKTSVNAGERPVSPSSAAYDPKTLKATLQNVYERLYPAELSAAASRKQIIDQEIEYRRLAREEIILLKRKAGLAPRPARPRGASRARDSFDLFMSDLLQVDWEKVTSTRGATGGQAVVETSYTSPMAVALHEEKDLKKRYHTRRVAEMQQSHVYDSNTEQGGSPSPQGHTSGLKGSAEASTGDDSFRIALFDEFLLRQNAYYFNRARAVRDLERAMTPAFTPATTEKSRRLVQEMVSRSLVNESMGPDTSSLLSQRQRQHLPVSSSIITQHQSPYRDPCTFQPQLSPAARAARAAEKQQRQRSPHASSPATHRKAFFDRLYGDHARMTKEREKAKEAAEAEAVAGLTFQPQLNGSKNAQVKSVLHPRNYEQYQQYLQKKRQSLDEQRQSELDRSEEAEEVVCTFRPQTTKTPAYISKMAKNFGVLRQQDTEF